MVMPTQYADAATAEPHVAQKVIPPLVRRTLPPTHAISVVALDEDDERISIGRGIVLAVLISIPLWALLGIVVFL
jgi:hypothetical protein